MKRIVFVVNPFYMVMNTLSVLLSLFLFIFFLWNFDPSVWLVFSLVCLYLFAQTLLFLFALFRYNMLLVIFENNQIISRSLFKVRSTHPITEVLRISVQDIWREGKYIWLHFDNDTVAVQYTQKRLHLIKSLVSPGSFEKHD